MATVIAAFVVTFLVGVWVGLLCGPGSRQLYEAYNRGFVEGSAREVEE